MSTAPTTVEVERCTVEALLGVPEQDLAKLPWAEKSKLLVNSANTASGGEEPCFLNQSNGLVTPFGNFKTQTVAELKDLVQRKAAKKMRKDPPTLETASGIDIGELQGSLSSDDCAMVQVASNFNCLENASKTMAPNCGLLCDVAAEDCTQGPAAAFGTLPAYIHRCHFFNDGGQTPEVPVNLLKNVGTHFGIPQNGKLVLSGTEQVIDANSDIDALADQIEAGIHEDCPILFGRSKGAGLFFTYPPDFDEAVKEARPPSYARVDQCFNASINYNAVGTIAPAMIAAHGGNRKKALNSIARVLIRATYQSVYLAAIARQRETLLLTLVGGGVFGNPMEIIVEELQRAHDMWAGHPASKLKTVKLCLYSARDEARVKEAMQK